MQHKNLKQVKSPFHMEMDFSGFIGFCGIDMAYHTSIGAWNRPFNPDFALRNKYTSKPLKKADSSSNTV